jgi:NAD(P)-dependent dehydrogenase (short-subunit alcohol dehydrogenase family)
MLIIPWLFLWLSALPPLLCGGIPREEPPLVVLITGCSTGIGKSIALEFANKPQKYKVWATMRTVAAWDLPVNPNLNILSMDVTSDESVTSAVDRVISTEGRIDVVINNAGYGLVGTVESVDIPDGKVLVLFRFL